MNLTNGQNLGIRTNARITINEEDNTTNNNVNIPRKTGKQKIKKQDPNIKKSIKFLNTNAQSLQYKISELAAKLNHEEIQIAGITESWGQEWNPLPLPLQK